MAPTTSAPAFALGSNSSGLIKHIKGSSIFVSQPDPHRFGNPGNEPNLDSWDNKNWLLSRFHFSFAEYSDPERSQFGVLRVLNDDVIQPHRGFGSHPHSNFEIVTYVIRGYLTHQDSMGTSETLGRGSVQFMTAGTGIVHSEHNKGDVPVRLIQMWIKPRKNGLKPAYGSHRVKEEDNTIHNQWIHLVSDKDNSSLSTPVKINQDANIYAIHLDANKATETPITSSSRKGYLVCIEGSIAVSYGSKEGINHLEESDGAHIYGQSEGEALLLSAGPGGAHLLLIEMAAD